MPRLLLALAAAALLLPAVAVAGPPTGSPLSSRLDQLASSGLGTASRGEQARELSLPAGGAGSLQWAGDGLIVQIEMRPTTAVGVDLLRAAGARVIHVSHPYRTVSAAVAVEDLEAVAGVAGVVGVREALAPAMNACPQGDVVSEGDAQLNAATARTTQLVDGTGVKVGVLSDSYDTSTTATNNAVDDIASGDLTGPGAPAGCNQTAASPLTDFGGGTIDEGRAMMQIVHDLAPGANLGFATAFNTDTIFANNIIALKDAGAKVIVDDITYFREPFFQDGPISKAVTTVTNAGVSFFSSAANTNSIVGGNDVASNEAPDVPPDPVRLLASARATTAATTSIRRPAPTPTSRSRSRTIGRCASCSSTRSRGRA